MHNVQTTTGDRDVDVRVLIELAVIGAGRVLGRGVNLEGW
ncbi:hypothetical protein ACZ87_01232 [Candidatus Erwinia dacicola]|uniref:Uncharacterized protein n=1 Tax=Candidatus Erwinia dacicola TaxID=252393 RepID=A0A328TQX6_9GAMM|nr:hypothetical protein ACZ87_01232 [Candidatus Erwinia dacicola]